VFPFALTNVEPLGLGHIWQEFEIKMPDALLRREEGIAKSPEKTLNPRFAPSHSLEIPTRELHSADFDVAAQVR
jgi:hypothetical protein